MDLSVIIVNHNTLGLTQRCIDSLFHNTHTLEFEVIVVDNGSTDGSVKALKQDERILLVPLGRNIGFGQANNQALKLALGRNILFLNPDTVLLNNAAEQLSELLDNNATVVACGANLYNDALQPALSFRRMLPSLRSEVDELLMQLPERIRYGRNRYFNHTRQELRVGYITGADLMVKRGALERIGGFAKEFFLYYEDTDLCRRLSSIGDLVSLPSAHIQHLEGASFTTRHIRKRRLLLAERGRDSYYKLHHTRRHHRWANRVYRLSLLLRASLHTITGHSRLSKEALLRSAIIKRLNNQPRR